MEIKQHFVVLFMRVLIKFSPRSRAPLPPPPPPRRPLPLVPHFFYHHAGDCTARIIKPVENAAGGLARDGCRGAAEWPLCNAGYIRYGVLSRHCFPGKFSKVRAVTP